MELGSQVAQVQHSLTFLTTRGRVCVDVSLYEVHMYVYTHDRWIYDVVFISGKVTLT